MLKLLRASPDTKLVSPLMVDDMMVAIKVHPKARHLTLRYNATKEHFVLTSPKRASKKSLHTFVIENEAWMRKQIIVAPEAILLQPGAYLPLEGKNRLIIHQDAPGVEVILTDETITLKCRKSRFPRALQRFVQQRAEDVIIPLSYQKAAILGKPIHSIRLRDTTTRWGSCTYDGKLSYSWRLIMAPAEVIDYVVGHEIAHLKVFNHSEKFWKLCRTMTDHTTFGKHWLQQNGSALHQIKIIETS